MRFLINYLDEYNSIADSSEFDTLDEVERAIVSAVQEGEYSIPNIQVYARVDFSVKVKVTF